MTTAAFVALLRLASRPWPDVAEVIEREGGVTSAIDSELSGRQLSLMAPTSSDELIEESAAQIAGWEREGIRVLTALDTDYPVNLRAAHDHPPLLFTRGRLESTDHRALAVIGSRTATATGTEHARTVAHHLTAAGYTVISGLAAGIDTVAHTATLETGGRTIAVIGTGLNHAYPPENAELQRRIATDGAVVSQFWPEQRATRESFPKRNAVMSGLSLGTIIVEASEHSGTRTQARAALAQGRHVFLAERVLEHEWARQLATRPGTTVFRTADEITAAVGRLTPSSPLVA